jgi:DNA-binding transcriptional MerR regulator
VATQRVRIGELARRTGVTPALLRAWEQRYGLLSPERTEGGLRLYSSEDARRVRAMRRELSRGLAAREAAMAVLGRSALAAGQTASEQATGQHPRGTARRVRARDHSELDLLAETLVAALRAADRDLAHRTLDSLFAGFGFELVVGEVLLPYLRDLGSRWEQRRQSALACDAVAEEHLATQLLRARLLTLAHGLRSPAGPRALLACPPGEQHDLALLMLAVALERRGWHTTTLGQNMPLDGLARVATLRPFRCLVVAATLPGVLEPSGAQLARLAAEHPVVLAGPATDEQLAARLGAYHLQGDPLQAAAALSALCLRGELRRAGSPAPRRRTGR